MSLKGHQQQEELNQINKLTLSLLDRGTIRHARPLRPIKHFI